MAVTSVNNSGNDNHATTAVSFTAPAYAANDHSKNLATYLLDQQWRDVKSLGINSTFPGSLNTTLPS